MARRLWSGWREAALIFAASLAAYFPALSGGFIWNDSDYVTKPALRSLGGLWRIWFRVGATEQYYPLLHSAFWLEHRLWGDSPLGYHLVNVLLHALSAWLLVLVLRLLWSSDSTDRLQVSAFDGAQAGGFKFQVSGFDVPLLAGLLFALHPVCVESVAWISEQKNTLSLVFYLLAALVYFQGKFGREEAQQTQEGQPARGGSISGFKFQVSAFFLFLCSCLSKTVTATLPGALLVVVWWRKGRLSWREDVRPLIPWFVVGAATGLFTGWVEKTYVGAQGADFALSLPERALVAGHAVWFYLGKLLWPARLIFIYPRWTVSLSDPVQWLYPIGVVVLVIVLWSLRNRNRGLLAALLFFLGSLFPVCGFFNLYAFIYSYVADHWQYLPAVGMMALSAAGWGALDRRWNPSRPFIKGVIPVAVLLLLGALSFRQSGMYSDMETFYRRTLAANPACWMAENNLGITLEKQNRLDEALEHYGKSLQIKPTAMEHYNMGMVLRKEGKLEAAMAEFGAALRLDPYDADALNNLGGTLGDLGRNDEAVPVFLQALRERPSDIGARQNLGIAYAKQGRLDDAVAELRKALDLAPDFAECRTNLGVILRARGRIPEAVEQFREAARLKPDLPEARMNLATTLLQLHDYPGAADELEAAARLVPGSATIHGLLGTVLAGLGRTAEAKAELSRALQLNPNLKMARSALDRISGADAPP
jgi:protein O-mannosyl-transferase